MNSSLPDAKNNKVGLLAQAGALLGAILASACCWLPLLLVALGVGGGTLSATFEAWRPFLLPVTFAMLGLAFYFTYRRPKPAAQAGGGAASCAVPATGSEACCPPAGRFVSMVKRVNRVMLWTVTAFVLAFAFFPNYLGFFLGGGEALASSQKFNNVALEVKGMTCEACAVSIEKRLRDVPDVEAPDVGFEKGEAGVCLAKGPAVPREEILKAISSAGSYKGRFKDKVQCTLSVDGMTCDACAAHVRSKLLDVPGVSDADVDYKQGKAVIDAAPDVKEADLKEAVKAAGYSVSSVEKTGGQQGGLK